MEIHLLPNKNCSTIKECVLDEKELNFEYSEEIQFLKAQKLKPSKETLNAILNVLNITKAEI